ncbi:MAG: hypothetical protein ABL977_16565 [Candidatus Eisenbacteria bacterium]
MKNAALSRREFVTLVAAGSAALIAAPVGADEHTRRKRSSKPGDKPAPPQAEPSKFDRELARQKASTLATLQQLRDFPLPPGGDLPVVFRPQRPSKRGR